MPDVRTLVVAVCAFVVACGGDATAPPNLARIYDLVLYEGKTLPVEVRVIVGTPAAPGQAGFTCSDKLIGGLLEFVNRTRYQQGEAHSVTCDDGRPAEVSNSVITGTYTLSGSSLQLDSDVFVPSPGVSSTMTSTASVSTDQITISQRVVNQPGFGTTYNNATLVFQAQP